MIVYDIEIVKAIPPRYGPRDNSIEYCGGWHDHANMGVSVIGVYDYRTERTRVFCEDNKDEFFSLVSDTDLCVGFNNIPFDNAVIRSCWGDIDDKKCYDLLRQTWLACGLSDEFNPATHGGYGLEAICEANFGSIKSGNGAFAPVLWQQGKIGTVIDYCLNDVKLTKQLLDVALAGGRVIDPKSGGTITLRRPF